MTICVMFPHRVKELCTIKNTGTCLVVVTLSIVLLNSHFLFGAGLVEDGGKLESFPCQGIYESYEKLSKYEGCQKSSWTPSLPLNRNND